MIYGLSELEYISLGVILLLCTLHFALHKEHTTGNDKYVYISLIILVVFTLYPLIMLERDDASAYAIGYFVFSVISVSVYLFFTIHLHKYYEECAKLGLDINNHIGSYMINVIPDEWDGKEYKISLCFIEPKFTIFGIRGNRKFIKVLSRVTLHELNDELLINLANNYFKVLPKNYLISGSGVDKLPTNKTEILVIKNDESSLLQKST